jgi:N-acetylglucosamine malate deacetylase 1
MLASKNRILLLSPHTDDAELGCGATITKLIRSNKQVYYATFSIAEESVPPPYPKNILETEVKAATKVLGIPFKNILLYKFPVRKLAQHRQEILEILVQLSREIEPDLVIMPPTHDLHQDHSTIGMEGLRAFKKTSILAYELLWNNLNFSTQCFVKVSEEEIQTKINALQCYESQQHRPYATEEFIRSWAITRGIQISARYAEVFECVRWIIN